MSARSVNAIIERHAVAEANRIRDMECARIVQLQQYRQARDLADKEARDAITQAILASAERVRRHRIEHAEAVADCRQRATALHDRLAIRIAAQTLEPADIGIAVDTEARAVPKTAALFLDAWKHRRR